MTNRGAFQPAGCEILKLDIDTLHSLYTSGQASPSDIVAQIYDRIGTSSHPCAWISLVPPETALLRAAALEEDVAAHSLPLYGVPFAIKDNIDLAGLPTTAGCPAYAYEPERNAWVVQALLDAGAIPIGKTNLDQFATGLVGMRSPYGACPNVFNERYISGGSSSGSAVAVAKQLVTFSLGTDTAGSGRVPAAFNNLIGLKPTRGLLSTSGVVPACRSLDCVSIFATSCHDARIVFQVTRAYDPDDPFSRRTRPDAAIWIGNGFRFGVPPENQREFFGDCQAAALYDDAISRIEQLGGEKVEINFAPFRAAANLLYDGPWVAERLAAIESFLNSHADDIDPIVYGIISGARRYNAVDVFRAKYRLRELRRATEREWEGVDVLVLPTTGTIYTREQVSADPIGTNANLGYYTNFANLLDMAAVAVPMGFRDDGLPCGITFFGRAFTDDALLNLADRSHRALAEVSGPAR